MKFDGTINIQTPRKEVWDFLTNPHAVSMCAPGLESLKIVEPDKQFQAMTRLSLGTVKVRFTLDIEWTELNAPDSAAMKARGTTPASDSSTDIISKLILTDGPDNSTNVSWEAEVVVVGKIASLAARLMNVVTRQLTDEFFSCVKGKIETGDSKAVRVVETKDVKDAIEAVKETPSAEAVKTDPQAEKVSADSAKTPDASADKAEKKEADEQEKDTAKAKEAAAVTTKEESTDKEAKDDKAEAKDSKDDSEKSNGKKSGVAL